MVDLGSRFCLGPISIMFDDFRHVVASDILLSLCPDIQCPIPLKMELRWSMLIQSLGMWSEAILDQRVVVRNSTTLQCYSPTKSESIRIDQNRSESIWVFGCPPLPATAGRPDLHPTSGSWARGHAAWVTGWGMGKIGKLDLSIRIDQGRKASVRITCPQSSADPPLFLLLWYFTTVFVCFSCSDFFSISLLSACTCVSLHSIFTTWELHYILLPHVTNLFCLRFCL